MFTKETMRLMALVEEQTGYKVQTGTTQDASSDAQMLSAQPDHPMHVINVSEKFLGYADYIVALQCAILLAMWSHPLGIPKLEVLPDTFGDAVRKAMPWRSLAKLGNDRAEKAAGLMVGGLVHQLRSMPAEILAVQYCHAECPSLRGLQNEYVSENMRRNSGALSPSIKELTPPAIYDKSIAMNAAFALGWSKVSGSETALLPYKAIGADQMAKTLIDLLQAQTGTMGERMVATVDAWAEKLELRSLYQWGYRERR